MGFHKPWSEGRPFLAGKPGKWTSPQGPHVETWFFDLYSRHTWEFNVTVAWNVLYSTPPTELILLIKLELRTRSSSGGPGSWLAKQIGQSAGQSGHPRKPTAIGVLSVGKACHASSPLRGGAAGHGGGLFPGPVVLLGADAGHNCPV